MKFKLKDQVTIIELKLPGLIKRIQIEESGIIYEVRYFWNAEAKNVWFYEEEIEIQEHLNVKAPMHIREMLGECTDPWHTMIQTEWMQHHSTKVYPRSCPSCSDFSHNKNKVSY